MFHAPFSLGDAAFTANLFGKPRNWSLALLGDTVNPAVREEFTDRLGKVLYGLHLGKVLAPSPVQFTDRIIDPKLLTTRIQVGPMALWRNAAEPADGVPLEPGEAYIISPANCPITVLARGSKALVLHTGRECLIDRHWLKTGTHAAGRRHHSICTTAVEWLRRPDEIRVKVFWAEPRNRSPYRFDDPAYGEINQKMYDLVGETWGTRPVPREGNMVFLNLPELVKAQCMRLGVPESQIDLSHAHQPTTGTWLDGTPGTPRNLFVLARRS